MPTPSDYLGRGLVDLPAPGGGGAVPDLTPGANWGVPGESMGSARVDAQVSAGVVSYSSFSTITAIEVTAARFWVGFEIGSVTNVRLGIYTADDTGAAIGAPLWDSGNIAVAADFTGLKTSADQSVVLEAGHYVAAIATSVDFIAKVHPSPGAKFIQDDLNNLVGYSAAVMSFGPFPTPAPTTVFTDNGAPQHFFLMQWDNV